MCVGSAHMTMATPSALGRTDKYDSFTRLLTTCISDADDHQFPDHVANLAVREDVVEDALRPADDVGVSHDSFPDDFARAPRPDAGVVVDDLSPCDPAVEDGVHEADD